MATEFTVFLMATSRAEQTGRVFIRFSAGLTEVRVGEIDSKIGKAKNASEIDLRRSFGLADQTPSADGTDAARERRNDKAFLRGADYPGNGQRAGACSRCPAIRVGVTLLAITAKSHGPNEGRKLTLTSLAVPSSGAGIRTPDTRIMIPLL